MAEVITQAAIVVKKEDRVYTFECANSSSLGEIYDALQEMRTYIVNRIQEVEAAQNPKETTLEVSEQPCCKAE